MLNFFRTNTASSTKWVENHPEFGKITFAKNKRSRSLRLSVKPFQGIQVDLPPSFPKKDIHQFLIKKQAWIQKAIESARETEIKSRQFFSTQADVPISQVRNLLTERLDFLANQYSFNYNKVSLRNQSSRWASCSGANNISLNRKLYFLPDHLCNYVLLHELAHTLEKNHGPKFWNILYDILGEQVTKDRKKALKDFEFLFYPPPNN